MARQPLLHDEAVDRLALLLGLLDLNEATDGVDTYAVVRGRLLQLEAATAHE